MEREMEAWVSTVADVWTLSDSQIHPGVELLHLLQSEHLGLGCFGHGGDDLVMMTGGGAPPSIDGVLSSIDGVLGGVRISNPAAFWTVDRPASIEEAMRNACGGKTSISLPSVASGIVSGPLWSSGEYSQIYQQAYDECVQNGGPGVDPMTMVADGATEDEGGTSPISDSELNWREVGVTITADGSQIISIFESPSAYEIDRVDQVIGVALTDEDGNIVVVVDGEAIAREAANSTGRWDLGDPASNARRDADFQTALTATAIFTLAKVIPAIASLPGAILSGLFMNRVLNDPVPVVLHGGPTGGIMDCLDETSCPGGGSLEDQCRRQASTEAWKAVLHRYRFVARAGEQCVDPRVAMPSPDGSPMCVEPMSEEEAALIGFAAACEAKQTVAYCFQDAADSCQCVSPVGLTNEDSWRIFISSICIYALHDGPTLCPWADNSSSGLPQTVFPPIPLPISPELMRLMLETSAF
jgi:hypothetical protein